MLRPALAAVALCVALLSGEAARAQDGGVAAAPSTDEGIPAEPHGRWPAVPGPVTERLRALFTDAARLPPAPPPPAHPGVAAATEYARRRLLPWVATRQTELLLRAVTAARTDGERFAAMGLLAVLGAETLDALDAVARPAREPGDRRAYEAYVDLLATARFQAHELFADAYLESDREPTPPGFEAWGRRRLEVNAILGRVPPPQDGGTWFHEECDPPAAERARARAERRAREQAFAQRPRGPEGVPVYSDGLPFFAADRLRIATAAAQRLQSLDATRTYLPADPHATPPGRYGFTMSLTVGQDFLSARTNDNSRGVLWSGARVAGDTLAPSSWLAAAAALGPPEERSPPLVDEIRGLDDTPRAAVGLLAQYALGWTDEDAAHAFDGARMRALSCASIVGGSDVGRVVVEVSPAGAVSAEGDDARGQCVAAAVASVRLRPAAHVRRAVVSYALGDPDAHSVSLRVGSLDALRPRPDDRLALHRALAPCVAHLPGGVVHAVRLRGSVDAAGHATITGAEPLHPPADAALARCVADAFARVAQEPGAPRDGFDDVVCVAHHVEDTPYEWLYERPLGQ